MRLLRKALGLEWAVVVAAAPLLAFPSVRPRWTVGALVALAATWLLRWVVRGEPWPVTPFNGALLLFALMIPVGVWASAFPEFTTPKAAGLVLGLATFRAVAFAVRDRRTLAAGLVAFCGLVLAIAAVGALGAQWKTTVGPLAAVAEQVPRLIPTLPGLRTPGVSPNQLAAVLALTLPLALALVGGWPLGLGPGVARWLLLPILVGFGAVVSGLLLLAQSRSGWIGGAAGLLALVSLWALTGRGRRGRVAGAALPVVTVAALAGGVAVAGPGRVAEVVYEMGSQTTVEEAVGSIGIAGRVEIWSRALYGIQDFPFTGCGLGAFRRVVHILYPLFRVSPDADIAHAHNVFLQTALDLGLPGLIGYLGLLMVAGACCWRAAGWARPEASRAVVRPTALGLAAGLVALHAYGITDALALGAKPGVALWFALGLVAALGRVCS
jgi:putative inorganic carbon (HCO3(-)) transporter